LKGWVILGKRHKLIKFIIAAVIVLFLGYQYYVGFYASVVTESAEQFQHTDGIDTVATFIRNEVPITSNHIGTIHFTVGNGEKVAKEGVIANIYESDAASAAASRINEIDKQLQIIADIEGYNDSTAVDVSTINNRISQHLNRFVYAAHDGRFSDVENSVSELLTMLTRKQVATGEQNDFSALKASLQTERKQMAEKMGAPKGSIKSEASGYFVLGADGFESKLTVDDLDIYTPEFFGDLKEDKVSSDVIGKIVYDYQWYLAAPVSLSDSMHYKVDQTVTIKTDATSIPRLTATVTEINLSKTGDDAIMILRCNEMNSELASLRTGAITIIKNEYEGIRVDSKALRVVDGVTGVYVVSGLEAKFVGVDIVYSTENYSVCQLNTADKSKLRLYDKIIVKGKNLYDGKIIY
jgi:hypothetical protein